MNRPNYLLITRKSMMADHLGPGGSGLGGCPRIVIFSQIEECKKNYRRYIVDIPRIIFLA